MSKLEDDLSRFSLPDLIALAVEITQKMKDTGSTKQQAERLRKVSVEMYRKSSMPQESDASARRQSFLIFRKYDPGSNEYAWVGAKKQNLETSTSLSQTGNGS